MQSYQREIENLKKFHANETLELYSKINLYVDEVTRLQEKLRYRNNETDEDIFTSGKIHHKKDLVQLVGKVITPDNTSAEQSGTYTLCQSSTEEIDFPNETENINIEDQSFDGARGRDLNISGNYVPLRTRSNRRDGIDNIKTEEQTLQNTQGTLDGANIDFKYIKDQMLLS